jgi:hypothetical protein
MMAAVRRSVLFRIAPLLVKLVDGFFVEAVPSQDRMWSINESGIPDSQFGTAMDDIAPVPPRRGNLKVLFGHNPRRRRAEPR